MSLETRAQAAADGLRAATPVNVESGLAQLHRTHRRRSASSAAAVAAVIALIVAGAAMVANRDSSEPDPIRPPQNVGSGPVWYDNAGLHHGDVVEQTPIELVQMRGEELGVLALVRRGALYSDPATGDVWFHPWGGEPRVVGKGSATGPGGGAAGDVAAWFEGRELVVYDTEHGVEISRTTPEGEVVGHAFREYVGGYEHVVGNGFLHVSADEVVWRSDTGVHRLDLATGTSSLVWDETSAANPHLEDVHDGSRVWGDYGAGALSLEVDGSMQPPLAELDPAGRLSADGSWVLSAWDGDGAPGAAFVDVRTGASWRVTGAKWNAWISWSYGAHAVLVVERATAGPDLRLLACDAAARECDRLSSSGLVLLPTT